MIQNFREEFILDSFRKLFPLSPCPQASLGYFGDAKVSLNVTILENLNKFFVYIQKN